MTLWNDMIIGICLVLLGWLLWKEFRRINRLRLPARIAASVVAVISLACLALPLAYTAKKGRAADGREGVLLTEGYDPDSLRQLLQTAHTGGGSGIPAGEIQIFSQTGGSAARAGMTTDAIAIDTASREMNQLSKLHVLGYGLTRKEWTVLRPPPLVFHPSPYRAGISSVSWKDKLAPGERCRIQGQVTLAPGKTVKLLLTGMGLALDSAVIVGGKQDPITRMTGQKDFELTTIPAQSGRSVYRLWVLNGSGRDESPGSAADAGTHSTEVHADTLEQESIPIEVLPAQKLRILLLASSPDFENTFLVNWLSRNGHAVATRTTISKGRSDRAFLNLPETTLDPLTPSVLDKFDLVIADAAALSSGNAAESATLRRQVAEKGMGLVIKADSMAAGVGDLGGLAAAAGPGGSGTTAFYKDLFPLERGKDSTQPFYIKERPGTQPLLRDSSSRILVSSGLYGSGKLVFTTLNTSYSRMLSGEKKAYAAYWSRLLQLATRGGEQGEEWLFTPDLPRVNEPVNALLQTNKAGLPQGQFGAPFTEAPIGQSPIGQPQVAPSPVAPSPIGPSPIGQSPVAQSSIAQAPIDPVQPVSSGSPGNPGSAGSPRSQTVYLSQAPLLPFQWQGTWWPAVAGWQSTATPQGEPRWWYVWPDEDWRSVHRRQRSEETREYIAEQEILRAQTALRDPAAAPSPKPTANPASTDPDADSERVPVSKTWFYAFFILSCLFLWVERKI